MRWVLGFIILVAVSGVGGFLFLKGYPQRKYDQWVRGSSYDRYYIIEGYKALWLKPTGVDEIPPYKEDYTQLWREFPLMNSRIPMPTRHPLFYSIPIIEMAGKNQLPQTGMIFQNAKGRELSRIYALPNKLYQDHSKDQDLFKLPYVRNRLLQKSLDELWQDIFSYQIEPKVKSTDEMIYDLYILHLRSKILPKETIRYGLIMDKRQAMVELESQDKDYKVEMVISQDSGSLFSYILRTEKNSQESRRLRSKFLESITFAPMDENQGRLLYTEFKQLNYARQVDQEGMLYLFSSWSQQPDNVDLLKEMIAHLERGERSQKQLKSLYNYAFKRYGKTFTTRASFDEKEDPEMALQRKIELEEKEKIRTAEENKGKAPPAPELTPDEKMNLYLKKAKEEGPKDKDEMIVH